MASMAQTKAGESSANKAVTHGSIPHASIEQEN